MVKQTKETTQPQSNKASESYNPIFLVIFFGLAVSVVIFVFSNFPPLDPYVIHINSHLIGSHVAIKDRKSNSLEV